VKRKGGNNTVDCHKPKCYFSGGKRREKTHKKVELVGKKGKSLSRPTSGDSREKKRDCCKTRKKRKRKRKRGQKSRQCLSNRRSLLGEGWGGDQRFVRGTHRGGLKKKKAHVGSNFSKRRVVAEKETGEYNHCVLVGKGGRGIWFLGKKIGINRGSVCCL